MRACRISHISAFSICIGARPPGAEISTDLLSSISGCQQHPSVIFIFSAVSVESPFTIAKSFVAWLPPTGSTVVSTGAPPDITTISVVPPPMSISTEPSSCSSCVITDSTAAKPWYIGASTCKLARFTQSTMFLMQVTDPVIICTSASIRTPMTLCGSAIPR